MYMSVLFCRVQVAVRDATVSLLVGDSLSVVLLNIVHDV